MIRRDTPIIKSNNQILLKSALSSTSKLKKLPKRRVRQPQLTVTSQLSRHKTVRRHNKETKTARTPIIRIAAVEDEAVAVATKTKTKATRRPTQMLRLRLKTAVIPPLRTLLLNKKMVDHLRHAKEAARKTIEVGRKIITKLLLRHRERLVRVGKMPLLASSNTSPSRKWSMDNTLAKIEMQHPKVMSLPLKWKAKYSLR